MPFFGSWLVPPIIRDSIDAVTFASEVAWFAKHHPATVLLAEAGRCAKQARQATNNAERKRLSRQQRILEQAASKSTVKWEQ